MSESPPEVEEITVLIAGLELTLTARPAGSSAGNRGSVISIASPATPASTTAAGSGTRFVLGYDPVNQVLIDRTVAAQGSIALAQLPIGFLDYLLPKFRSLHSEWTGQARVGRAFKAGVVARLRLSGQYSGESSEGVPFRSTWYLALQVPGFASGFWTQDYNRYIHHVTDAAKNFHPDCISHGFPTQAECEAYLVGAGRPWPLPAPWKSWLPGFQIELFHNF